MDMAWTLNWNMVHCAVTQKRWHFQNKKHAHTKDTVAILIKFSKGCILNSHRIDGRKKHMLFLPVVVGRFVTLVIYPFHRNTASRPFAASKALELLDVFASQRVCNQCSTPSDICPIIDNKGCNIIALIDLSPKQHNIYCCCYCSYQT